MRLSIDQSTDYSHRELYSFFRGVDLPVFVKEAELDEVGAFEGLPKTAFADQMRRLFPVNTKARVYTSNAFFVNKKAELEKRWGKHSVATVQANIEKAAEAFGIKGELATYNKLAEAQETEDYKEFSVTMKLAEYAQDIELYRIKTAAEASAAAKHFATYVNNYPFAWRRKIASDLIGVAKEFNVDEVPDLVCKYAGMFYPEIPNIADEIYRRATKLASADHVLMMCELATASQSCDSIDEVFKVAEAVYEIEREEGVYKKAKVAKILGDIVDRLFPLDFTKAAAMVADTVKVGNEMYSKSQLESVPAEIYHQSFGVDLDPKSAEWYDILPTVPRSDFALFKQLSGVKPL